MSVINNGLLLGAGADGYQISRSVRLRSSASAYFNRTPASAGNRKTWTWSGWVKRGNLSNGYALIATTSGSTPRTFFVYDSDSLWLLDQPSGTNANLTSTAKFRDPSAWYHVVLSVDTTQATLTNRVKMYVNGVEQTISGTYPTQNTDMEINKNVAHTIGSYSTNYFDGYMTEINFIDGQALTPSYFGETNAVTGVWQPKKYAGTYGTNGFYLNFSDNSGATATTIGKDNSGNGNNWTPNNISVTAGVTYDSMTDVPTLTSATAANYCVLNPLEKSSNNYTFSNGNLAVSGSGAGSFGAGSTIAVSSGKWYWEQTITAIAATDSANAGIRNISANSSATAAFNGGVAGSYIYRSNAFKRNNATATAYGATFTTNDVIGVALDLDAGTLTFYKNGTSQGTAYSGLTGTFEPMGSGDQSSGTTSYAFNFGQRPFSYTPPTGFVALNTQNLPAPTILKPNKHFDVQTFTGNGASQTITGMQFGPDFIWGKSRGAASSHRLIDRNRGVTEVLYSDTTTAGSTEATALTSFNSDGYTMGGGSLNPNTVTMVDWLWKGGGTAVSNTAGTITSSVSANPTAGFSVVTYTGTGTTGATVGHGLGAVPQMIIVKNRSAAAHWPVGHVGLTSWGYNLYLSLTNAQAAVNTSFNSTTPTSTVFTLGPSGGETNFSGQNFVAYCFTGIAGYSAFGSYTGNGSADGTFVYCGFRPRWIMIKQSSASGQSWVMIDTSRDTYNAAGLDIYANLSNAEANERPVLDVLSNGFKVRNTYTNSNTSGATYIYAAFAENPFKNSLAR